MNFYPDLGVLLKKTSEGSARFVFSDIPVKTIYVLGDGKFTALANVAWEGCTHALSIDFDDKVLEKIFSGQSKELKRLIRGSTSTRRLELKESRLVTVSGYFGGFVQTAKQVFVPLIVEEIKGVILNK
jgi:hypothetical protein